MSLTSLSRTPEALRAARCERVARKARENLTDFKRLIYRRYQHAPHLERLDWSLEQVTKYAETCGKEGIGRLIVEMPPRHGKTLTVSRLYPTWHLGRNPDHRVMLVSYGASLARKNSRFARAVIRGNRYQSIWALPIKFGPVVLFDTKGNPTLDPGSAAAEEWNLAPPFEGGADAMGIGGAATGKGAHVLIIDDPIKNRSEAESEIIRDKIWDSYTDDLMTRLEPGGAVVVMMTRWHEDDLIGRLLRDESGDWVRLRLPALAEEDDPLGRKPGEALWPWRYPRDVLEGIRERRVGYTWSSIYQQSPVPAEGGLIKNVFFDNPVLMLHEPIMSVRGWDLAMSEKTSADYTASIRLDQCGDGKWYWTDATFDRIDWDELTDYLAEIILADGPAVTQGIEEKGFMTRAITQLNADDRLHHYGIFGIPVDSDKVTRALPWISKFASKNILMTAQWWNDSIKDIMCSFPKGAHDDPVDAFSVAWAMVDDDGALAYGEQTNAGNPRAISASVY